ncbi:PAS domain S-box protein [Pantanalinema sp. GBBB05]|uniref:PAS domain S-box protein n=1 Tax=Pantanalinema sp. GBBB05 TaxID=2604139 RepID=UPI001D60EFA0|nr:PAS domain S-box protein [Pantanalinema sp. GBBB05]
MSVIPPSEPSATTSAEAGIPTVHKGLADISPVGILYTDVNGNCRYANPWWCRVAGIAEIDAQGQGWVNCLHPDDRQRLVTQWQQAGQCYESFQSEYRLLHPDGKVTWVLGQTVVDCDAAGVIQGYVSTVTDISDRKQMEEALQRSQQRFEMLVNDIEGIVWELDPATFQFTFVSQKAEALLGYPLEQWLTEPNFWQNHLHPDDHDWVTQRCYTTIQNQQDHEIEYRMMTQDGQIVWLWDLVKVISDGDRLIRLQGVMVDITNRKQVEVALAESEGRYRQLINHLNAGLVVHAPDTRILLCNATAYDLLGLSMEQLLGKTAIDPSWHFLRENGTIMPPEEFPVNQVLQTQAALNNYVLGISRRGHPKTWVLVTAFPECDRQGQLQQIVVTFIDISGLKQAEAARREMSQVLENAVSGISQLDAQGRYLYVNKAYADISGYPPEAMIGMPWQQTVHPDDLEKLLAAYAQMQRDDRVDVEARGIRQDGSVFYKQLVLIAAYNEAHQFVGHYCFMKDISDRELAKAALERELLRSQTLFNISIDGVVMMNQYGDVVQSSLSFAHMLGYTLEDTLMLNVADWDAQWTKAELQHMLTNPQFIPLFETQHRRQDGSVYDVEISWNRVELEGEIMNFCICRDISDRKQMEAERQQAEVALRHSEATKQGIIQAIPDLLIQMQTDGTYVDFMSNSEFNVVNPEQIRQGVNVCDILPPDLAQIRLRYAQQALASSTIQIYEQAISIQGKLCYEEVRVVPFLQDQVLVMVRDITDRKQAEAALRHQKEMFQAIVDHIPAMIALFNHQAQLEFINPELERTIGWSLADWQQREVFSRCYPDLVYRQKVVDHMLAATGKWQDFTMITAIEQQIETTWANVRLSNGQFLGIGQDISDRKQREVALQQAIEAAEAANLAKSIFLANMSHELRTPLNVILGFTQVMAHDVSLTSTQQDDLQTIRRSGDHLLNLINDVLDLSKIEAGHCVVEVTGFDLIALLHSLRTMLAERANFKGIDLHFDIAPEVPQFVLADSQKLRQILLNLLSNAIKFTDQGGVVLRVHQRGEINWNQSVISSSAWSSPPMVLVFEVEDTGVGIAPAEITPIFDAFVQAQAGKRSPSGTGLGLTISRKLLELMGGEISVHSLLGQGSTFTFTLPVRPTSGVNVQPEQSDRLVIGLAPGQRHYRILVVDDQSENRSLLVRLLTQLGLEVREASNGQDAIQIWQAWQPDLTWMDIRMPGMDGYEVTKQIRAMAQGQASIIIALTAQASQSDRSLALAAGCNDYISKPFREATLFLKMAEYLNLQYQYAESGVLLETLSVTTPTSQPVTRFELDPVMLTAVSKPWLEQLEDAAICGYDHVIFELIMQLPPELATLADDLRDLAHQYRFEQILQWLHQQTV